MAYMKDSTGKRLDAFPIVDNTLLRPQTLVALGDSMIEQAGGAPVATNHRSYGMLTWAQFFMGHRLGLLRNSGVGGQRTDQILARVQTDVIALAPGYCLVTAGTNDVTQAIPLATIKTNLSAIWSALDNAGIRVVATTIPPRNTYTGTQKADTHALNNWIRNEGRRRRNLRVADIYSVVVNPASDNFESQFTPDGIHLGNKSAPAAGKAIADTFAQIIGPLTPTSVDLPTAEQDLTNVQPHSRFTAGTIADNTPPTGWIQASLVGGPITYQRIPRTDGLTGSWLRITVPAGASAVLRNANSLLTGGRYAVGDVVQGAMEVRRTQIEQAPAAKTSGLSLQLQALGGGNPLVSDLEWFQGTSDNQASFDQYGVMQTEPLTAPAGITQFQLQITFSGAQVIDIDRATIRNLTRNIA